MPASSHAAASSSSRKPAATLFAASPRVTALAPINPTARAANAADGVAPRLAGNEGVRSLRNAPHQKLEVRTLEMMQEERGKAQIIWGAGVASNPIHDIRAHGTNLPPEPRVSLPGPIREQIHAIEQGQLDAGPAGHEGARHRQQQCSVAGTQLDDPARGGGELEIRDQPPQDGRRTHEFMDDPEVAPRALRTRVLRSELVEQFRCNHPGGGSHRVTRRTARRRDR